MGGETRWAEGLEASKERTATVISKSNLQRRNADHIGREKGKGDQRRQMDGDRGRDMQTDRDKDKETQRYIWTCVRSKCRGRRVYGW